MLSAVARISSASQDQMELALAVPAFQIFGQLTAQITVFPLYSISGISYLQSDAIIFKEIRNGRRTSLVGELFGLRGLQILVVEGTLDELALGPCSGTSIFKF
jgi:hypothetical protein